MSTKIQTIDKTEYLALVAARDAAQKALDAYPTPELIVYGKRGQKLRCPWCGDRVRVEGIVAVDASERWTYSEIDFEEKYIEFHYDGYGDHEGQGYTHGDPGFTCGLPVAAPAGWEMD